MGRPSVLQLNVLNRCHHAATQAGMGPDSGLSLPLLLSSALGLSDGQRGPGLLSPLVITAIKANPGPIQAAFVLSFISSVLESFSFQSSTQRHSF